MTDQANKTAGLTYDITYADLAGANSGQRPDLLTDDQDVYRTPDGKLYSLSNNQLVQAQNLVASFATDPLTGGVTGLVGPSGGVFAIPTVYAKAAGRASAPISTFDGAASSGALGKPADILIPANMMIDGQTIINIRARIRKVGTDAASFLQLHFGPANSSGDTNVFAASAISPQFTSVNPFDTTITVQLAFKSSGFGVSLQRDVPNVGAGLSAGECTGISSTVANYINFVITGATASNTYQLLSYDVALFP